jgi:transcriptional regulator with XRE-family HTH domain
MYGVTMEFHEKIRHLREHIKDWTQAEVAEKLHVDTNTYGCIERGETHPNLRRLQQIAKVFGIKLEELVSEKDILNIGMDNSNFSHWYSTSSPSESSVELQHELEKTRLLLKQKDKEIDYLKQQNADLRQQNADLREMAGLLKK